jgi:hypothetical protein
MIITTAKIKSQLFLKTKLALRYGASTNALQANKIKNELVKILSAIESKNFPRLVIWLYFLAIYPSKKSVAEAITKIQKQINEVY